MVVSVGVAMYACVGGRRVCHGAGGAPGGPVLLLAGCLPAVDRARTRRVVLGVAGFLWGSGSAPRAGVRCQGGVRAGCPPPPYSSGWVWLRSWQVTPGVPGSLWPCGVVVVFRCAARLDARSCRGLCGVPALDGAGAPEVRVALVARCWCGVATGVGGAEVDGLGDVEDVAADVWAHTFVVRDWGGGVAMVAVLREE